MTTIAEYAMERLYEDQDADLVVDAIPSLLAWLTIHRRTAPTKFRFGEGSERKGHALRLSWSITALASRDQDLERRVRRLAMGTSAQREHVTELAAYGLAMCALSVLLPGRRAIGWSRWVAPDILLDDTPSALRGIEVAGRSKGGGQALAVILEGRSGALGKKQALAGRPDLVEAYVSLWSAAPAVTLWMKVKP